MTRLTRPELKSIRRALGLTAEEMASLMGIPSERTIRRWEYGERQIPGPAIEFLCSILAVRELREHLGLVLDESKLAPTLGTHAKDGAHHLNAHLSRPSAAIARTRA